MLPSQWLKQNPKIASAIVWEASSRSRAVSYPEWTGQQQRQLDQMYKGEISLPSTPPTNLLKSGDNDYPDTRISEADAWLLYLSYVAASLGCEIDRRVPWSIVDYPASALTTLLDSRSMFERTKGGAPVGNPNYTGYDQIGYQFDRAKTGFSLPAPAAISLAFLKDNGIWPEPVLTKKRPRLPLVSAATARLHAAYRMIDWCRNLVHFSGGFEAVNIEKHWQYRGSTPAVRMMEQTIKTGDSDALSYTFGCWGTVGFIRSVLRAINIPVDLVTPSSHAQLWLPLEGQGLCHGDDPYMRRARYLPEQQPIYFNEFRVRWPAVFPVKELMINQAEYDTLFGPAVTEADKEKNVSAVTIRIAKKYLPYYLLQIHCHDLAAGTTNKVTDYFGGKLTEAEAAELRGRLDAKLPSVGGCAALN